jgi:hypothetical protein
MIPPDIAWRIFTKGIGAAEARARSTIDGDNRIGVGVLGALAIVG